MPLIGALGGLVGDINLMERLKPVNDRHIVEICQDDDAGESSEVIKVDGHYHCAHCNQVIHELKDYLVIEGCITAYCQTAECQESKKQTADWLRGMGLRVRKELEWIK